VKRFRNWLLEAVKGPRVGVLRFERSLRSREDDGAVDAIEHVVERGRGICHRVCAVCDDEAVI